MILASKNPISVFDGVDTEAASPNAPNQVRFEATIGAGRSPVRPPSSARAAFDKAATGVPVPLNDNERAILEEHGVRLADVTHVVANLTGTKQSVPLFKSMQPVAVTRSFVPVSRRY